MSAVIHKVIQMPKQLRNRIKRKITAVIAVIPEKITGYKIKK